MDSIRANLSTIIVAALVFGILLLITLRLIQNKKKGKLSCGCDCGCCASKTDKSQSCSHT